MKRCICLFAVLCLITSCFTFVVSAEENTVLGFSQYNRPDTFSLSIDFDPHQIYRYSKSIEQDFLIFGLTDKEACKINIVSDHHIAHSLDLDKVYSSNDNHVSFTISPIMSAEKQNDLKPKDVIQVSIIVQTSVGRTFTRNIYVIQSQHGLFIGYINGEYTIDLYYKWLYENDKISASKYDDYCKLRHTATSELQYDANAESRGELQDSTLKVQYTIFSYSAGKSLSVYATLYWSDVNGNYHPARNVKYVLYDDDVLYHNVLASGQTNNNGSFNASFINDIGNIENGFDLRISYKTESTGVTVQDVSLPGQITASSPYSFDVILGDDITTVPSDSITQYCNNSIIANAFQVHQAMCIGAAYVQAMSGNVEATVAEYPGYDGFTCFYFNKVYIGASYFWTWDTILHEYGHAVAQDLGIYPMSAAQHSFDDNLVNDHGKGLGTKLAWQEGWATYFSYAAQTQQNAHLLNVPYVGDITYDGCGIKENGDSDIWHDCYAETTSNEKKFGEANEATVCRALWDMMDCKDGTNATHGSIDESFDQVALGYQGMWNLIDSSNAKTFSEFMAAFYSQYPITTATGRNVGGILGSHGFTATSLTKSGHDADGGCVFFWTKPTEPRVYPYTYYLQFYGASMNLIRSIDVTSSSQPYTMSGIEWSSIMASAQGKVYICIKVTSNIGTVTGPYYSAFITYPS